MSRAAGATPGAVASRAPGAGAGPGARRADAEKFSRGGLEGALIARFRRRLVAAATGLGPATVLDAGCGEGFVTRWLADALPGARIEGVDASEDALAHARRRLTGMRLRRGDVHALDHPAGAFDLVVCTEVLEHVDDPAAALDELRRVARGHVLATVPHEPFFRAGNLARGRHARRLGSTPGHRWTWTRRGLLALVGAAGAGRDADVRWISLWPWQGVLISARRPA